MLAPWSAEGSDISPYRNHAHWTTMPSLTISSTDQPADFRSYLLTALPTNRHDLHLWQRCNLRRAVINRQVYFMNTSVSRHCGMQASTDDRALRRRTHTATQHGPILGLSHSHRSAALFAIEWAGYEPLSKRCSPRLTTHP